MADITREIDVPLLDSLAVEVDAEHHESMITFARDMGDVMARRRFLRGFGAIGAAGAALLLASESAAATPVAAPNADDIALLAWVRSLELAAVAAYDAALGSKKLSAAFASIATMFRGHHQQHADAIGGIAGRQVIASPNAAILAKLGPSFTGAKDEAALVTAAYDLENAAASTYLAVIGKLIGTDGARLAASIQPTEARHAFVLGQALQVNRATLLPERDNTSAALSAADYPIVGK